MKITLESACIDTREGFSIQVKRSSGQWQKYPGQLFETNVESRGTCVTTSAIQSGKIPTMDVARPFPRSDGYRHIVVLSGTPYCNHLVGVSASTLINNFGQITCHELRGACSATVALLRVQLTMDSTQFAAAFRSCCFWYATIGIPLRTASSGSSQNFVHE